MNQVPQELVQIVVLVQETMGDTIAQTRSENVSKLSNDPLLARGNTLRSGEDRLKLKDLTALCITLQSRVLALETTKDHSSTEVGSSRRVESSEDEGLVKEDASKQGRIADIDANKDIYLVNVHHDEDMFRSVCVVREIPIVTTVDELTCAQALAELKVLNNPIRNFCREPSVATTNNNTTTTTITATSKLHRDKANTLQDEKAEKNKKSIALTKEWNDIHAKIEADHELAQRL
ncbi:hypothetical protein Tco_0448141 [Tanacetum coccineum]